MKKIVHLAAFTFCATLPSIPAWGFTVTYGSSTIHTHSVVNSAGNVRVTLDPDPIQNSSEFFLTTNPSQAFRDAMTKSKAANDWKNDLTFNYVDSSGNDLNLGGNLTIDVYKAAFRTESSTIEDNLGGAQLLTHYNRAAIDPAASDLYWIQVVTTNKPNGGETIPYPDVYFSPYPAGGRLPFYYTPSETNIDDNPYVGVKPIRSSNYTVNGINYDYDIAFWDWPSRTPNAFWRGELFLATYDQTKKEVNVYDGIQWGFTILASSLKDFGDAPDSYKTLLASDGSRYQEGVLQRLGGEWDGESDGQPTVLANGDDLSLLGGFPTPVDDEDGVIFGESWVDVIFNITRPDANKYQLRVWWDTNENGVFDHTSELYIDDLLTLSPGIFTKRYNLGFDPKDYYSRFRLTWDPLDLDVKPFGEYFSKADCNLTDAAAGNCISHGEVEDFAPVPEPTSALSLLALGALGTASISKRQLQSSKSSEKETTKVG